MSKAGPPLRRLVGRDVGSLFDAVTTAVPGLALALLERDGALAYASGPWPDGVIPSADGVGIRAFDLVPRDVRVGSFVVRGDAPPGLLEGMERSVALLVRGSLEKHDLARETLERYREINLLYRASETLGSCLNAVEVPRILLAEANQAIPFAAGVVFLGRSNGTGEWDQAGLAGDEAQGVLLVETAAGLIAETRATGRPDIVAWPDAGPGRIASALAVPVRAGETVLGLVVVGRTAEQPVFSASDERLLLGLAGQAGVALERTWLHERERQRMALEEELAVARRIQLTLLPSGPPEVPGWRFAASYRAARQVGGDFYDFLDHAQGDGRLGLVIGDVTGKGVPAALMMAYARAVLRAESTAGRSPVDVLANTNRLIMQERRSRLFVSAFYAELDLEHGLLTFADAGHDAPLWVAADGTSVRELEAPGAILGAFVDIGLQARSVVLRPGDTVVLYTDGVTEARNPQRELFGDERLQAAVGRAVSAGGGATAVLDAVTSAVADFAAGTEPADDLTLVVVQREGSRA